MRDLDDTDMEILSLLAEDARRPFSGIGEAVGLSGPAVSDRVDRLREAGIINRFTVDVDRAQLRAGVPVLVRVTVPSGALAAVRGRVREADGVEHTFVTAEGDLVFSARADARNVRTWVEGLLEGVGTAEYEVTLLDEVEWTPSVEGLSFALTCAECGNTVDSEGETARIDGEVYHFCCGSCLARFEERYRTLAEGA
jgi:Lrp/AsnC family leucine-responsive transcriptional regulator